jgi:carbohydrate kinase (thermoresistant glucokinase family)
LKQSYRDRLMAAGDVRFIYLRGDFDTIAARVAARHHRYMPASLLGSQFDALEAPSDAIDIDVTASIDEQVRRIVDAISQ